jgi:hypothetical protein
MNMLGGEDVLNPVLFRRLITTVEAVIFKDDTLQVSAQ